ncbi:hypothetical protein HWV62_23815 [Athelia sp. TMB]|nr:hypothetical protein HWV62_23815 [Athelia sp. TMB]
MGEDQLIDVFKSVDHETAASAVRNLNNVDVGGRPLRIDLADSDPFLEGKTTVRGELVDSGESRAQWREREREESHRTGGGGPSKPDPHAFMANLPPGVAIPPGADSLDAISNTLGTMNPVQLIEVLAQMKVCRSLLPMSDGPVIDTKALLVAHPQFAYALFQALLLNKIVDPGILNRMLAATAGANPVPPPPPPGPSFHPAPTHTPQPAMAPPPNMVMHPPPNMYQQHQQQMPPSMNMHQQPPFYGRPPPPPAPQAPPQQSLAPQVPNIAPDQHVCSQLLRVD